MPRHGNRVLNHALRSCSVLRLLPPLGAAAVLLVLQRCATDSCVAAAHTAANALHAVREGCTQRSSCFVLGSGGRLPLTVHIRRSWSAVVDLSQL